MSQLHKKRMELLEETIEYYKKNDRCKGCLIVDDDVVIDNVAMYSGITLNITTRGDVIGRLLSPDDARTLDINNGEAGINVIFEQLPKNIQDLRKDFLIELSVIHDCDLCWFERKLTKFGEELREDIIHKFC